MGSSTEYNVRINITGDFAFMFTDPEWMKRYKERDTRIVRTAGAIRSKLAFRVYSKLGLAIIFDILLLEDVSAVVVRHEELNVFFAPEDNRQLRRDFMQEVLDVYDKHVIASRQSIEA